MHQLAFEVWPIKITSTETLLFFLVCVYVFFLSFVFLRRIEQMKLRSSINRMPTKFWNVWIIQNVYVERRISYELSELVFSVSQFLLLPWTTLNHYCHYNSFPFITLSPSLLTVGLSFPFHFFFFIILLLYIFFLKVLISLQSSVQRVCTLKFFLKWPWRLFWYFKRKSI